MSYIGREPIIGNFVKLDAISVVNGQASYTMQNGGANFTEYSNVNQFLVSLNGILQSPTDSFTVSGSTITFASNLLTGDVIDFIIVLGNSLDVGVPSDNTVSTAKLQDSSVSLAKLTATGTKDATTFLRGDNTFAEVPAGGITMVDMWRMTAHLNSNADPISANLERVDDATFAKIGTGMTESSGTFSFPETGLYEVHFNYYGESNGDGYNTFIKFTSDNSTYTTVAGQSVGESSGYNVTGGFGTIFNVTDITNDKVRFATSGMAGNNNTMIYGDTSQSLTYFQFIRLGDSQ